MSIVLGVLVIGALLSAIFGRRAGALFVTGTTAAFCVIAIPVIGLVLFLVIGMVTTPSRPNDGGYRMSYSPPPSSASPAYAPAMQAAAPAKGAPASQATSLYAPPATGTGPRIGVDIVDQPANGAPFLAYLHPPAGAGAWIRVHPGSPAEAAGLRSYDVILSAGTQGQPAAWITPTNSLPSYLDRVGYGVPVRVHVYRATGPSDFWTWVYPR